MIPLGLKFQRDGWLGGYASFAGRLIRLGHISFIGLGFLNILLTANADEGRNGEEYVTAYRAFPRILGSPSKNRTFGEREFAALEKKKMQTAPSVCQGHKETDVWYAKDPSGRRFYVLQVKLSGQPEVFIESMCTFTPYQGMDYIDGLVAKDVEAYVLNQKLGYASDDLRIFDGKDEILFAEYLRARGVDLPEPKEK